MLPTILLMTLLIFLFLCCKPLLKKISAKWRYYSWLVIVIGLLIPFRPVIEQNTPLIKLPVSGQIQSFMFDMSNIKQPTGGESNVSSENIFTPNASEESPSFYTKTYYFESSISEDGIIAIPIPNIEATSPSFKEQIGNFFSTLPWGIILLSLWLIGAAFQSIHNIMKHHKFKKMIQRWAVPINDNAVLDILNKVRCDLGISTYIQLKTCEFISSPMLLGDRKPLLLLPSSNFSRKDLALIFRHECTHLKRHDVWYKLLVMIATTIYWFYPPVYLMSMAISSECELSCDEETLKDQSLENRIRYGEIIISLLQKKSCYSTPLTTYFYESKRNFKHRILSITNTKMIKRGLSVLCIIFALTLCSGSVLAITNDNSTLSINDINAMKQNFNTQEASSPALSTLEKARLKNSSYLEQISIAEYFNNEYDVTRLTDSNRESLAIFNNKIDSNYIIQVIANSGSIAINNYQIKYTLKLNPDCFDKISIAKLNQIITECAYSISYCAAISPESYFTLEDPLFNAQTSFPKYYKKNWAHLNIFEEISLVKIKKL